MAGCGGGGSGDSGGDNNQVSETDTTPPSIPQNLTTTTVSDTQIDLSWSASTDDVGVAGYKIYRDGTQIDTTANTSYSDTGLISETIYTYTVSAYDAAGNESGESEGVSGTTQVYYVSPTGTALWSECANIDTPCSWQTAVANAVAGDLILFRGGTYEPGTLSTSYEVPAMNPSNSGTNGNPITFQAYPGETAIIHDAVGGAAIGAFQRNYIVWDGFTIDRNLDTGEGASSIVRIEMSNHITIRNCDMIGRPHKDHTNGTLIAVVNGSYIDIYNNKLHGVSADPNPIEPVVNASAIWVFDATNVNIYNNDVYDNNIGISWKVDPSYINVYQNHIYNCERAAIYVQPETSGDTDFIIYQNVVRNCRMFVQAPDAMANPYYNLKVYNNTVYNSGEIGRAHV